MKRTFSIALVLAGALALSACTSTERTLTGAAVGGATGAAVGGAVMGTPGAVLGAGAGAYGGAVIANEV